MGTLRCDTIPLSTSGTFSCFTCYQTVTPAIVGAILYEFSKPLPARLNSSRPTYGIYRAGYQKSSLTPSCSFLSRLLVFFAMMA